VNLRPPRIAFIALALLQLAIVDLGARGPWVTLQNCHFLSKRANDGDSFHVSVNGKEYIFRLYFVDAPETTNEFRDRVEEQAQYFGIRVDQVVKVGEMAKKYTREKLSGPFTIRTCFQDALGRSRIGRSYAIVQTANGDLGEQLVENGLARIHGNQSSPEGITSARREWQKLTLLQQKAKREKVGAWGVNDGRMTARAQNLESAKGVDPFDEFFHPEKLAAQPIPPVTKSDWPFPKLTPGPTFPTLAPPSPNVPDAPQNNKLDVNAASQAELENLPGVGPVMAQRIIAARPFNSADDLRAVKGIGDKKYEKIRPYFW
jgi:competence ComEA-like helix-hairpin-helix protein